MQDEIELATRIFVSYAHDDNDLLGGAVERFCADLKTFHKRNTGRDLEVFFDRASIGWGEDWRSELYGSLLGATIFMPVVTMIYFDRPNCRDELNAFEAAARRIDARYLILPVLVAGRRAITADHPMPEVRLIESLQYVDLERVFIAGPDTREWREALHEVAGKLAEIAERAEKEIDRLPTTGSADSSASTGADRESDLIADMQTLEELGPRVRQDVEDTGAALSAWGMALRHGSGFDVATLDREGMRAYCLDLAERIAAPSAALHEATTRLSRTTQETDVLLRQVVGRFMAIDVPELRESVESTIGVMSSDPEGLQTVSDQMADFLNRMQVLEMISVPLRQAIKPARYGIRELQDTLRVVQGWSRIRRPPPER